MQQITENCIALGKVINKPNIQISFLSYLLQGTKKRTYRYRSTKSV